MFSLFLENGLEKRKEADMLENNIESPHSYRFRLLTTNERKPELMPFI